MSGGDDQMGRSPAQTRTSTQSVNGDNCGGADRRSFLHGLFLDLYPPLLLRPGQFEQRPNERPLSTRDRNWTRADW